MPLEATSSKLVASRLHENNEAIDRAIASIIDELKAAQSSITGVRPSRDEFHESFASFLDRQEALKGRGAYYPYIGSGIGKGPLVELLDGSVKYDMINGIGVHMFGHSDPDLVEVALRASLGDTPMQGNLQFNADAIEFGELLVEQASKGSALQHAFLINTGAMANESALKVCMQKRDGKAPRVLAFRDCFMGRSTTMAQIGDSAGGRVGLPLNTMVDYLPFYNPEHGERSIEYAIWHLQDTIRRYPGQHCCFVMELVQGEGGFNTAPREFFVALMEICKENGIPVWVDEIQTFGRTPEIFCFQTLDLGAYVDVVTLGKMSQVCAVLFTEEMNPKPGLLSATFIGSTVSLQVGRRLLTRLRDGGYYGEDGRIAKLQEAFRSKMQRFIEAHPEWFPPIVDERGRPLEQTGHAGGIGGMMRFTPFAGRKQPIIDACHALFEEGVICFYCGHDPYHIRFLAPVGIMTPGDFDDVFEVVGRGLARVAN